MFLSDDLNINVFYYQEPVSNNIFSNTSIVHLNVDVQLCKQGAMYELNSIKAKEGIAEISFHVDPVEKMASSCLVQISVPEYMRLHGYVEMSKPCGSSLVVRVNDKQKFSKIVNMKYVWARERAILLCQVRKDILYLGTVDETRSPYVIASGYQLFFLVENYTSADVVRIYFTGIPSNVPNDNFFTMSLSNKTHLLALPGVHQSIDYPVEVTLYKQIDLPPLSLILLSFSKFQIYQRFYGDRSCILSDWFELFIIDIYGKRHSVWKKCGFQ